MKITTLTKEVFQIHGVDVMRKQLRRERWRFFANRALPDWHGSLW